MDRLWVNVLRGKHEFWPLTASLYMISPASGLEKLPDYYLDLQSPHFQMEVIFYITDLML